MAQDEFDAMLNSLARGWTERDYHAVIAFFSDNVFYSDPQNYTFNDKGSLLDFFLDDDGRAQVCVFHNSSFDEEKQIGVAEYTYEGTNRYHGTAWIEIVNGKIARWREYQHRSDQTWEEFWKVNERDRP